MILADRQLSFFAGTREAVEERRQIRTTSLKAMITSRHRSVCEKTISLVLANYEESAKDRQAAAVALGSIAIKNVQSQGRWSLRHWHVIFLGNDESLEVAHGLWELNERNLDALDKQVMVRGLNRLATYVNSQLILALKVAATNQLHTVGPPDDHSDRASISSASISRKGSGTSSVKNLFSSNSKKYSVVL
jgi:hypothetical protein